MTPYNTPKADTYLLAVKIVVHGLKYDRIRKQRETKQRSITFIKSLGV